jgi:DNA-binding IclR family transcriptional regulator
MYNAPILKKGIEILKLITRTDEPLGVSEIARRLSIVKSTALGILKSLEEEGFVAQDSASRKFVAGSALYQFSREALRSMELPVVAKPFLQRLVELVDETVILAVRDEDSTIRVLEVVEPKKELKITVPVGTRFPFYTSAFMKVFLSQMTDEDIARFVAKSPLPCYTDNSITRIEDLLGHVQKARQQGYATDLEEYRIGVKAVASLVFRGAVPRAAISIFGLAGSMDDLRLPEITTHLRNTAQLISTRLSVMAKAAGEGDGALFPPKSIRADQYSSARSS